MSVPLLPCPRRSELSVWRVHLPERHGVISQALLAAYARAKIPQWEKVRRVLDLRGSNHLQWLTLAATPSLNPICALR